MKCDLRPAQAGALAAVAILLTGAKAPAFDAGPDAFRRHMDRAAAAMPPAARDSLEARCSVGSDGGVVSADATPVPQDPAKARVTPTRVFDNLYFVGDRDVSVWALATSKGLILIDATHGDLVEDRVIGGLKQLGLDPATIRYVIVTHGHDDHYGGARLLQERYGARVLMGAADWATRPGPDTRGAKEPLPRRDIAVTGERTLRLGDTVVRVVPTPGHTPGTVSVLFAVTDHGQRHVVALVGGGHPFGSVPRMKAFVTTIERFAAEGQAMGMDVVLSNHPKNDDTLRKLTRLAARGPDDPNPFVMGSASSGQLMTMAAECGRAWLALNPN